MTAVHTTGFTTGALAAEIDIDEHFHPADAAAQILAARSWEHDDPDHSIGYLVEVVRQLVVADQRRQAALREWEAGR